MRDDYQVFHRARLVALNRASAEVAALPGPWTAEQKLALRAAAARVRSLALESVQALAREAREKGARRAG